MLSICMALKSLSTSQTKVLRLAIRLLLQAQKQLQKGQGQAVLKSKMDSMLSCSCNKFSSLLHGMISTGLTCLCECTALSKVML